MLKWLVTWKDPILPEFFAKYYVFEGKLKKYYCEHLIKHECIKSQIIILMANEICGI